MASGKGSINGGNGAAEGSEAVSSSKTFIANAEDLTTSALKFLSTASNETLGGVTLGLAACTFWHWGELAFCS